MEATIEDEKIASDYTDKVFWKCYHKGRLITTHDIYEIILQIFQDIRSKKLIIKDTLVEQFDNDKEKIMDHYDKVLELLENIDD